jgi:hypothetical protein
MLAHACSTVLRRLSPKPKLEPRRGELPAMTQDNSTIAAIGEVGDLLGDEPDEKYDYCGTPQ